MVGLHRVQSPWAVDFSEGLYPAGSNYLHSDSRTFILSYHLILNAFLVRIKKSNQKKQAAWGWD